MYDQFSVDGNNVDDFEGLFPIHQPIGWFGNDKSKKKMMWYEILLLWSFKLYRIDRHWLGNGVF